MLVTLSPPETWNTVPDMKSMSGLDFMYGKNFRHKKAATLEFQSLDFECLLIDIKLGSSVVEDLLSK